MKRFFQSKALIYIYIFLMATAFIYFLAKPIILIFNLCSFFGTYCKYFTGIFYNSIVYWLILVGIVYSLTGYIAATRKNRRFLKQFMPYKNDNEKLNKVLAENGKVNLLIIDSPKPIAFASGFIRKRLYLSSSVIDYLEQNELKALVFHEMAHMKNNDIIYLTIAKFVSNLFFYLPGLQTVYNKLEAESEYNADLSAAKEIGNHNYVVDALLKISDMKLNKDVMTTSFSGNKADVLNRIKKLQGEEVGHIFNKAAAIITTVMILFVSVLAVNVGAATTNKSCPMHKPIKINHFCLY